MADSTEDEDEATSEDDTSGSYDEIMEEFEASSDLTYVDTSVTIEASGGSNDSSSSSSWIWWVVGGGAVFLIVLIFILAKKKGN